VIFMHENMVRSPGVFYRLPEPEATIGVHTSIVEEVGAEGNTARAALYPMFFGESILSSEAAAQARNMGHNLADFTGGDYGRAPWLNFETMTAAGRDVSCLYRVAFKPPDARRRSIHDVKVQAAGLKVPYSYRVRFVTDEDRVMRRAMSVLRDTSRHQDLGVTAALVPQEAAKRRWKATIQVALDLASLELLPVGGSENGQLDVGALLINERTGKTWEMLAGSSVRKPAGRSASGVILYENSLDGLKPGLYRLKAFVHNEDLDLYGGDEVVLDLPKPREAGLIGPVAACPGRAVFPSSLPLRKGWNADEGQVVRPVAAASPYGGGALTQGERLSLASWFCSGEGVTPGENLFRLVEQDGVPLYRLPRGWTGESGRCLRFTDLLDTIELAPGRYTYRIFWLPEPDVRPVSKTIDFVVAPNSAWAVQPASQRLR
jgi:hypothetical protein